MAINYSGQRQAVVRMLENTKAHPDAESVYRECRKEMPGISLATVYRNLALLERCGKIVRVATVDGRERYDANVEPHCHAVCDCCGAVRDVEVSQELAAALQREQFSAGYDGVSLNFRERCENCRRNENKMQEKA